MRPLDTKNSYVRMLFIDFCSAFNTIIPQQLIGKTGPGAQHFSMQLAARFPQREATGRVGRQQHIQTHHCAPSFSGNHILNDKTVVGLISNNDETHYRQEVSQLATWCKDNNLFLNVEKTEDVVIDFRESPLLKSTH